MDLIPKPDQVVSAAGNVAHTLLYGGLADLRPMPRTLIDDGELREVYHYRPAKEVEQTGDPVLLVTPLAAPALCFDLRRGCSLVEHLVTQGRPTYLVEYGQVSFKNRALGVEHWVDEVLPEAIRTVHEHSGGRPVHLVGWSLGGIFAMLATADRNDLPIASLTVVGSPVDVTKVPLVAPVRPLLNLTQGRGAITRAYRALGGIPTPLVNWAFTAASAQKVVTKPLAVLTHLDDTDYLAQLEAVTRFMSSMTAYPGRTFGQLYHRFVKGNALAAGRMDVGDRTIDLAAITVPVLVFAGNTDGIAPLPAVRAVVPLLSGAEQVRFEVVPGGHLGMLTGRAARGTTWQAIDEWVAAWSGRAPAAKKAPVKKAPGRKAASKKTPAKKTPATDAGARTIGSNPSRRYGSAGSRALGQR
ncbi:Alpha/beta hydrolase fold protein [metagenome]|uniref:Alpha/beta hydrolase fold protein n=1 Tax=metagenome TaxID=256318 RepID=A0A2P2CGZ3_9ZZZZ